MKKVLFGIVVLLVLTLAFLGAVGEVLRFQLADSDALRLGSCIRGNEDSWQGPWFSDAAFSEVHEGMSLEAVTAKVGIPVAVSNYCDGVQVGGATLAKSDCGFVIPQPSCQGRYELLLTYTGQNSPDRDFRSREVLLENNAVKEFRRSFVLNK